MTDRVAAYGLNFTGVMFPDRFLSAQSGWPDWTVTVESSFTARLPDQEWGPERSVFHNLQGGAVVSERAARQSRLLQTSPPPIEAFAHPLLGYPALAANAWLGRLTFHAGVFALGGRAWIVAGDRGAGKSSLLGWFAANGGDVLADDLAVVDGHYVFAGPRCVDLRESAAGYFGAGDDIGVIGSRQRWRIGLPTCPATVRLAGWVRPVWNERIAVTKLSVAEQLSTLAAARAFFWDDPAHSHVMALMSLPAYEFSRPRDFGRIDQSMGALMTALHG